MRSVQIFKIIQGVFGPAESGRIVRVLAGQAVWDNFLSHMLAYQDTAANADVMAIAPYFNAVAAGDPANVATTLTLSSDQIVDQMLANIRGDIKSSMTANAALAARYKLKLKAYESGPGDSSSYFPADKQDAMTAVLHGRAHQPADARRLPRVLQPVGRRRRRHDEPVQRRRQLVEVGPVGFAAVRDAGPGDGAEVPGTDGLHRRASARPLRAAPARSPRAREVLR